VSNAFSLVDEAKRALLAY